MDPRRTMPGEAEPERDEFEVGWDDVSIDGKKLDTSNDPAQGLDDGLNEPKQKSSFSKKWTSTLLAVQKPLKRAILAITHHAATHPKIYIVGAITISVFLLVTGLLFGFSIDVNEDVLWTPRDSRPLSHGQWLEDQSGFPAEPRMFNVIVHTDGDDVLGQEGVSRLFSALDVVRTTPGYDALCAQSTDTDFVKDTGEITCRVSSATKFWNDTLFSFEANVQSDVEAISALSSTLYPDGTPVDPSAIYGRSERDESGILTYVSSYVLQFALPDVDDAEAFETDGIDSILALKEMWEAESDNPFRVEVAAERSFSDEFTRAIVTDIPLVPAVFIFMSIFTCIIFWRRDWVYSRSLLGFGAVVSVLLSIMAGYGLLFLFKVPFTSMTQILPFIMFGIGLDDAFIITGAYMRTDYTQNTVLRIHNTFDEVGISILLTTITSVVAFALGCTSSIPAVYWLCLYAFPTIFFVFLFQITFFVALIVMDEQRVRDKRRDCFVCCTVKHRLEDDDESYPEPSENAVDKFMVRYSDILIKPFVKAVVITIFAALLGVCAYSASKLSQEFTDVVPSDSYVIPFWTALNEYGDNSGAAPDIVFRFVNQSDPSIQQQMMSFVDELVELEQVSEGPSFFWLEDFLVFVEDQELQTLGFNEQLGLFLADPTYHELYNDNIVLGADGNIITSRTRLRMDQVDQEDVTQQIDALESQQRVSTKQLVNEGRKDWAFFTFDGLYYIWSFYSVAGYELILSTILGIVAVSVIGLLFIPHWSGMLFVAPMITVLYVDLLGVLQFAGIHVNAVSYISLVMSIGLLVDFIMHVLLRYYESTETCRETKVKDVLRTMGTSVLIGGISTFLGVVPLAFSTSEIFNTIFVTFMGLVTLGIGHGLILLPVLLSLVGTTEVIQTSSTKEAKPSLHMQSTKGIDISESESDLGDDEMSC